MARMGIGGDEAPKPLTDAQRAELSDIERRYAAKIAEREIFLRQEMDKARAAGDAAAVDLAAAHLRSERADLEEARELAKERVRKAGA